MERRLKEYLSYMESLGIEGLDEDKAQKELTKLKDNIAFFQHERLVHLLVTLFFGFLLAFAIWGCLSFGTIAFFGFFVLVMVLLVPYIRHYYILENGVQKLYTYYDRLIER